MAIEIKAPAFPESVADGTVATWHKQVGEAVKRDELIVDIETDKVVMEVLAEADGVLTEIVAEEGATVLSGELLGKLDTEAVASAAPAAAEAVPAAATAPAAGEPILSPAARKIAAENQLQPASIPGTGKDGRVTKEDAVAAAAGKSAAVSPAAAAAADAPLFAAGDRTEKRVPMTRLRAKVAERLVEAQSTMAMLTTYNEVNMKPIMDLRAKYKDLFEKTHNGTRLGFMSFFVKAATEALKRQPGVNASIDGKDIVYHGYQDIGVAVSSDRGLVVPVLRNAELMGLAEIEAKIREYGLKARDGKLSIEEMTAVLSLSPTVVYLFTVVLPVLTPSNCNPGHAQDSGAPNGVNGEVVILPMMYLALS